MNRIALNSFCLCFIVFIAIFSTTASHAANDYIVAPGGKITGQKLSGMLANSDVTLKSSQGDTAGTGDVIIKDIVTWTSGHTLTLIASNNVKITASITATGNGAGIVINPKTANGGEPVNANGTYLLTGASITISGNSPTLEIAGEAYTVINTLGKAGDETKTPPVMTLQGIGAAGNLANKFALGSNIDASGTSVWNSGQGFAPIGSSGSNIFTGKLDGLGHTISHLNINRPTSYYAGLFGFTSGTSIIRNVGLNNGRVLGKTLVGGLIGNNLGGVSNCFSTVAVSVPTASTNHSIGGLFGTNNGSISHCYATSDMRGKHIVGGLVGTNIGSASYSYATGEVTGIGSGAVVGGFVGVNQEKSGKIDHSYASGSVIGTEPSAMVGGFVGRFTKGQISSSYWNSATTDGKGGGTGTFTNVSGLSVADMKNASNFSNFTFTTNTGVTNNWVIVDADGTLNNANGAAGATLLMLASEYSTVINNAHQLQLMAMKLDADYTLGGDVDAAGTSGRDVWTGSKFVPVGNSTNKFTGSFNGAGNTISKLNVKGADNVGLFGNTDTTAVINNLGLVDSVTTGVNNVGTLAGINSGNISDSYAENTNVTGIGTSISGSGGLVGKNAGSIASSYAIGVVTGMEDVGGLAGINQSSISSSYAFVNMNDATNRAGGLVGTNASNATITTSYAVGTVAGNGNKIGGLVGSNAGTVSYSNAVGKVNIGQGSSDAGGLVGSNESDGSISNTYATGGVSGQGSNAGGLVGSNSSSITNSYATGKVIGSAAVGELVGNNSGTITDSYWNSTVNSTGVGQGSSGGATGLTAEQMMTSSNFRNFTFTATPGAAGWVVLNTDGSLQTASSTTVAATSPMLASEYSTTIYDGHQLQLVVMNLAENYTLAADIEAYATRSGTDVWGSTGFIPIGKVTAYTGVLDGQNHVVNQLYINRSDDNVGLFGQARGATIKNIGLTRGFIAGNNNLGSLSGYTDWGLISKSYADAHVKSIFATASHDGQGANVGVLVGSNGSNINNSYSTGMAYGREKVGGLAGHHRGSTIANSYSSANSNARKSLTGEGDSGGLVGLNDGNIGNSYATGDVISKRGYAGGLVGNNNSNINNSYARNNLLSSTYAKGEGGLVGTNSGHVGNSYWDTQAAGVNTSAAGNPLTCIQMLQQSSFNGWDFTNVWEMDINPVLRNMPAGYLNLIIKGKCDRK